MDISAQASSLAERPQPTIWVTSVRMPREDRTSILAHPLADLGGYLDFFGCSRGLKLARFKGAASGQNTPCDARQFVGERDRKHVAVQSLPSCVDPVLEPVPFPAHRINQHHPRCLDE